MGFTSIFSSWTAISGWFFLEYCRACGQQLPGQQENQGLQAVCAPCWDGIEGQFPLLHWCRLDNGGGLLIASGAYYQGRLKKLIYRWKYDEDWLLTFDLGRLLRRAGQRLGLETKGRPEGVLLGPTILAGKPAAGQIVLVPVPLHAHRQDRRQFNQADLLAGQIGQVWNLPVEPKAMRRVKDTAPQHGLNRGQRLENLQGAFQCQMPLVKGRVVILVDDIYTSGATLAEAARTALGAGAASVAGLTIARAV